eukprot:2044857-Karenia_brevis.AAC.1
MPASASSGTATTTPNPMHRVVGKRSPDTVAFRTDAEGDDEVNVSAEPSRSKSASVESDVDPPASAKDTDT